MKYWVRQIHLFLGLLSGVVVFVVGITGSIYAFEKELREVIYKDLYSVQAARATKPKLSTLLDAVKNEYPSLTVKSIFISGDSLSSVQVNFKNKLAAFADPYSGKILGSLDMEKEFFAVVLKIHRSLGLGEPGKIITGTSTLLFLVMLVTGIILWWPKNRQVLSQKVGFKKNSSYKRRLFDLHSVLGFYAMWILIFSALTGLIWSFKWAENTMYWLTDSRKEEKRPTSSYVTQANSPLDKIFSTVYSKDPARNYVIVLPEDSTASVRVNVNTESGGFFKKQDLFYFDQYSGSILYEKRFDQRSLGDQIKMTNYNIHTGKVFGLVGQCLVFFAALIAASLPVTGFLMWMGKQKKKQSISEELGV